MNLVCCIWGLNAPNAHLGLKVQRVSALPRDPSYCSIWALYKIPIAISGPQGHSDHRTQLLKDIEYLQTNKGLGKVATDTLSSLLTSMASYLKYEQDPG